MLERVREPFLDEPVRREVDARGQVLRRTALDLEVDRQARFPDLLHQAIEILEARLRRAPAPPPAAQHVHEPSHLCERLAAVCSTTSSASRSFCCSGRSRRRTAEACTVITLTACPTTSCSSRAIRARSSVTASRASASRPLQASGPLLGAACCPFCPRASPASQMTENSRPRDPVAGRGVRLVPADDQRRDQDDRQAHDPLAPIRQHAELERNRHHAEQHGGGEGHETAVHEREGRGGQRDRRGRGEREATAGEMRQDEQQEGRDGEGQRLFRRVRSLRATTASTTTTTAPATTSASNAYRQKSGRTASTHDRRYARPRSLSSSARPIFRSSRRMIRRWRSARPRQRRAAVQETWLATPQASEGVALGEPLLLHEEALRPLDPLARRKGVSE